MSGSAIEVPVMNPGSRWAAVLHPLSRRITLAMALLLAVVVSGMLWLAHQRVVNAVGEAELTRLEASASQLASAFQNQARRLGLDAARTASLPGVRDLVAAGRGGNGVSALRELAQHLEKSPQNRAIGVWSTGGELLAYEGDSAVAARSRPDSAVGLEMATTPIIGSLGDFGGAVAYTITAPVTDLSGAPRGYVVVTRAMAENGEAASVIGGLVGREARVLLGNADRSFFSDLSAVVSAPGVRPAPGSSASYTNSKGDVLFGAAAAVTESPWAVVVEVPAENVLAAASQFAVETALLGVFVVVIGAFLSWLLIRRVVRPLALVTDAARGISEGDLTRRVPVDGRGEIGVLSEAFNQMVERVARSSDDLAAHARVLEATNKSLNDSEAKYRGLFEHLPDGILVHRDDRILFANPAAVRMLGASDTEDLATRRVLDYVVAHDRGAVRERIERVIAEHCPAPTVEVKLQRVDHKLATAEATCSPLIVEGLPAVQTILHDVSERRLLEEQLRQSQKMDAVGRLAGGVAHDFNNLLTVIQAHAEFALGENESEESRRNDIVEIRKTADHAARLTRQLLTFSRKQTLAPAHIDLNEAISGMLGMMHRLIGDNIEVVTVAGKDLAGVWADPGQIQQVLLNLAVNARDAMPDGGVLRFETANVTVGEGYIGAAAATIPAGTYVMLAVQDTGIGMSEEIRSRVFEPFFTTKQAGRGTGLGLSTVYGIVKQSQGHIWVYSEPGMGTAFKVFFPPYIGAPAPEETPETPGVYAREHAHLLVVEDDPSVRAAVVRALRAIGYTVTEAQHAEEAIAAIGADPGIELMITDMVMPGKPGVELLADVRSMRPRLPAIILSGYSEQATAEVWRVPELAVFVEKPVSPAELVRRVRQLLAARG